MAYSLITPLKSTEGSTKTVLFKTTEMTKCATAGAYIKTGGSSRIDPSRLVFVVFRASSKGTDGLLTVVSGSTAGNSDYQPGGYSTLNNLNITIQQTGTMTAGVCGRNSVQTFVLTDPAKYMDTDEYIKFIAAADISSKTNASLGMKIGALYMKQGGH